MSDTLKISGKFYADVAGFKATDDSDVVQTYIRPQGSTTISSNGTDIDVTQYATVTVNVSTGSTINNQNKTVTPTESQQTVTYDVDSNNYTGLGTVTVNAISPTYIGSGITQNDSSDLTVSGATVTVPAGYYSTAASKSIAAMTLPTSASSSATSGATNKATISRSTSAQYINIPIGYNDTAAYYTISATPNGSVTAPSSISGTTATVSTGTNTLTLTKTVSVTPNVTTAGYISSGTAGNSSVSLTADVTVNPTPTASGATVTIPAGYYSSQTTKSVSNGSATAPVSISDTSATVSTGTNTLTLTKTISVTPSVTAGYISSGTAGNSSVSLTASVTTKDTATITPGTSDQTIAAGTYLTGAQTIEGDANLVAANIKDGVSIFGVTGTHLNGYAVAHVEVTVGSSNVTSITFTNVLAEPIAFAGLLFLSGNAAYMGGATTKYITGFFKDDSVEGYDSVVFQSLYKSGSTGRSYFYTQGYGSYDSTNHTFTVTSPSTTAGYFRASNTYHLLYSYKDPTEAKPAVLLWENPSPNTNFAQTTINLSASGAVSIDAFDKIRIVWAKTNIAVTNFSTIDHDISSIKSNISTGTSTTRFSYSFSDANNYGWYRYAQFYNDEYHMWISPSYKINSTDTSDGYCIPIAIYGLYY